jgi:hypothetical protein
MCDACYGTVHSTDTVSPELQRGFYGHFVCPKQPGNLRQYRDLTDRITGFIHICVCVCIYIYMCVCVCVVIRGLWRYYVIFQLLFFGGGDIWGHTEVRKPVTLLPATEIFFDQRWRYVGKTPGQKVSQSV